VIVTEARRTAARAPGGGARSPHAPPPALERRGQRLNASGSLIARTQREFALGPSDNARLANLCGPLDENLRLLETRLDVRIRRRGGTFRVSGAQAESAEGLLRELSPSPRA